MIEDFAKFLKKIRKKNGDKLLPVTTEQYEYYVSNYYNDFEKLNNNIDKLIDYMNVVIRQRPSIVIYSAFRIYLIFIGVEKDSDIIKKLKAPAKSANAFTSKRFLQSKVLSRGELKRLFTEVDDEMKLIFSTLYDLAARRSELLNIKFGDMIFYDEPKNNIYGEINILGKGAKSRVVFFGRITNELLNKLRPNRIKEKKVFEFYKEKGKLYEKQADRLYYLILTNTQKILGRHITPHCLRHTRLTHMANLGADILSIARYAGHENVQTTTIYIEISTYVSRNAFEKFSENIVEEEEIEK